ncbi:hypothetical protein BHE74_00051551 [Ensete ventricosum]|nr:hypothetical protein GW17_00005521 [Ensete ventricosum]RWW42851.1 hypothetical protein BHE74_00051551 [Ensete ventricosum]
MHPLRFPNSGIRTKVAGHGQAPCRGSRPWPGYLQGAVARRGSGHGRLRPALSPVGVAALVIVMVAPWQGGCRSQRAAAACAGTAATVVMV